MRLLRVLGVVFGVAVTLGGTIGIGILRTPGMVAANAGSAWATVLIWLGGGVFSLFAAVSIAELAVLIPRAGGFYVYAREVFGGGLAFAVGWCDCLGQVAAIAYGAVTAGDLLTKLGLAVPGAAPALILLIGFLQWLGIRTASRAQEAISFMLAACYLILAGAAFLLGKPTEQPPVASSASLLAGSVVALRAVIVAYDGWYSAIYFAEEVTDLPRNLPRSMIEGVVIVTAVYVCLNAALLHALGLGGLAASGFPGVDAARTLFGWRGERIVILAALLSIPSLLNALTLISTRILYGMGMSRVNRRGTPELALGATIAASLALALTGTFERLLAAAAFFFVTTYVGGLICMLVLRRRRPDEPRPFRAWMYPWPTLTVLALCLMFLMGDIATNPLEAFRAAALIAASYPVYRLIQILRRRYESA